MLPAPLFTTLAEPLQTFDETVCDPVERPGVHAFFKFVIAHQGGQVGRTLGPCGGVSGHASGRAWDWMIRADVPAERARADEFIAWLLQNDAEMFRRAGLSYIIWDRKSWSAFRGRWVPYDGYDVSGNCTLSGCRDPHISHVHFSFNKDGADGKTSFYKWLASGQPVVPPPFISIASPAETVVPAVLGATAGFFAMTLVSRSHWWERLTRRVT